MYPEPQLQALKLVNSIALAGAGTVTLQPCITLQVFAPIVTEKFVPVVAVLNALASCCTLTASVTVMLDPFVLDHVN